MDGLKIWIWTISRQVNVAILFSPDDPGVERGVKGSHEDFRGRCLGHEGDYDPVVFYCVGVIYASDDCSDSRRDKLL